MADDYSNNTSTTGLLVVGAQVTGNIELPADEDWFKVQLQAGTTYVFDLIGADGGGGTLGAGSAEARLVLYGTSGSIIQAAINGGTGGDPRMSFTPTASGNYYLGVEDLYDAGTGTYTLTATSMGSSADDYSNNTSTTGLLVVGAQVTGNIELPADEDWFKVQLQAGTTYVFDLIGADGGGGTLGAGSAEARLVLYGTSGSIIQAAINGGTGGDPRMSFTPTASGNYYLGVEDLYDAGTGTYTLTATSMGSSADDYSNNTSTTGLLVVGAQVTGNIELPADEDWFKVQLQAGTTYVFDLIGADGGGGTLGAGSAEARLVLYGTSGSIIQAAINGGTGGDPRMSFTPTASGNYYLGVEDLYDAGTGTYTLTGVQAGDPAPASLSIAPANAIQSEGNSGTTNFTFTVSRVGDTTGTSSANWATSGAAVTGADFAGGVLPAGVVTFAAGETSKQIIVPVAGDTAVESNEAFTVTLSSPSGATLGTATAGGTILNDDAVVLPTLAIAASDASKNEGNSGTTNLTFTVSRAGDTTGASFANWAVSGAAVTGADFAGGVLPSGVVTFAAGETSKAITVLVSGDTTVELDEGFTVTLSSPSGATLGTSSANGTILNDDGGLGYPTLDYITDLTASQMSGATLLTFQPVSADEFESWAFEVKVGTWAPVHSIYQFTGVQSATYKVGSLSFFDPYDLTVYDQHGNAVALNSESDDPPPLRISGIDYHQDEITFVAPYTGIYFFDASLNQGSYFLTYNVTVFEDIDTSKSLSVAPTNANQPEGNSGTTNLTFTVSRAGDTTGASFANWAVSGAAVTGADFAGGVLPSGVVTFAAGETSKQIIVPVAGDTAVESNEAFTVTLSSPSGATLGTATAGGTILNDDSTINGNSGNNALMGTALNDLIQGLAGNDTLNGLGGDDTLDGGEGTDVAQYSGLFGNYDWSILTTSDGQRVTLADTVGGSGTDTLLSIESLQFGDKFVDIEDLLLGQDTIYSFFNTLTGQPIYTASAQEAALWTTDPTLIELSATYRAPLADVDGATPVHRIYSSAFDLYVWTGLDSMKSMLLGMQGIGIQDQGVAFYAYQNGQTGGTVPIHMLWDFDPTYSPLRILYADEASLNIIDRHTDQVVDQGVQFWL